MKHRNAATLPPFAYAFLLLFTLMISGCGDSYSGPRLSAVSNDAIILAFGDSLTYGTGAERGEDYPSQLQRLTGLTVVNAGIAGELTAEGLKRLPQALETSSPSLVILCLGGNDMLRKLPRAAMKANLIKMVELAEQSGSQVLLLGVPEPALFGLSADPSYAQISSERSVAIENHALARILAKASLKSDPIHPNAAGYKQLADAIAVRLRESGAL